MRYTREQWHLAAQWQNDYGMWEVAGRPWGHCPCEFGVPWSELGQLTGVGGIVGSMNMADFAFLAAQIGCEKAGLA